MGDLQVRRRFRDGAGDLPACNGIALSWFDWQSPVECACRELRVLGELLLISLYLSCLEDGPCDVLFGHGSRNATGPVQQRHSRYQAVRIHPRGEL